MTLAEFLLARIAEDEQVARDVQQKDPWAVAKKSPPPPPLTKGEDGWQPGVMSVGGVSAGGSFTRLPRVVEAGKWAAITCDAPDSPRFAAANHIVRHQPVRVLAECEAKRRRVGILVAAMEPGATTYAGPAGVLLKLEALPYADHPDYREEWRP
jgi:Family of unknown function (DUF6221)